MAITRIATTRAATYWQLREPLTGGSEPGIELERAAKLRDRLVVLALPGQGQPEVVGVLRVAAIAAGRFAKGALAAGEIAAAAENHAE